MTDYKQLLAGLVLLLLIIITGALSWLWFNNSKTIDPLPILSDEDSHSATQNSDENDDTIKNNKELNTLYLQAQEPLQVPLDDVIVSFEARYPHIQVLTNYVPAASLLTLDNTNVTDMVIANDKLSDSLLALLQDELNSSVENNIVNSPPSSDKGSIASTDNAARTLNPFSYAMKNSESLEGVILNDKPVAINFRNFLVSSTGQDILRQYELDSIDNYQNSVDDLFSPTSDGQTAVEQTKVVTDALTNGE